MFNMTKEEKEKAKMLEGKINCIQANIDRLCEMDKIAGEKNAKIKMSYLVSVALVENGEVTEYETIGNVSPSVCHSLDLLINDLFTKKRIMEIDLNQLKIAED